ncbi:unnamed protein product [marine sediment metagenome]|uniref:Uncharacterized protein n=1 Tax=marine sediment metagenome TaxID=412755 RepID=X1SE75_9ZZZZ
MPRAGQHTPISDEEAEEWARRMVRDAEDLDTLWDADEWEDFTFYKLGIERGKYPSPAARNVLATGRSYLAGEVMEGGFTTTRPFIARPEQVRIRDLVTGRFISWENVQKAIVPFRPF